MIGLIQMVITPAMLAFAPPTVPVPTTEYNWQTQQTEVVSGDVSPRTMGYGSLRGTSSYVGSNWVVDDWNSD